MNLLFFNKIQNTNLSTSNKLDLESQFNRNEIQSFQTAIVFGNSIYTRGITLFNNKVISILVFQRATATKKYNQTINKNTKPTPN